MDGNATAALDEPGRGENVDEYHAELEPADKVDLLKELQSKYGAIAMIGDGVNDAPAVSGCWGTRELLRW